jgi:hypothetical protein
MLKNIVTRLLPALAIAAVFGFSAQEAQSATNGAGFAFHANYPGDAGCFQVSSYGGIVNTCASAREITVSLPVPEGWHNTTISIYGSGSWCQTVSTNGVGNGANIGAQTWTTAGPKTWQTLNLGDRYVWNWSPVVFRCGLEAGGVIGSFTAS